MKKSKVLVSQSCLLFATPWTVACQAPLSMEFSRQEYWSEYPFPSPGDLPNPGIKPRSPALQADSLPSEPQGAWAWLMIVLICNNSLWLYFITKYNFYTWFLFLAVYIQFMLQNADLKTLFLQGPGAGIKAFGISPFKGRGCWYQAPFNRCQSSLQSY